MEISTSDLCDKILGIALQGSYLMLGNHFSFQKVCEATGASSDQAEVALLWLWKNSYLEKTDNTYVLTPLGEIFAKSDGCAGQRQRQAAEEKIKQQDLALARLANQVAIETNKSTKRTSRGSLIVAICAAIISLGSLAVSIFALTIERHQSPTIQTQIQMSAQSQNKQDSLHGQSKSNISPSLNQKVDH